MLIENVLTEILQSQQEGHQKESSFQAQHGDSTHFGFSKQIYLLIGLFNEG